MKHEAIYISLKIISLIVIASLIFGGGLITFGSDIDEADFYGTIITTNNGTAATSVSSNISVLNTASLISASFLNSSANNCAIQNTAGADTAFMPGLGSNSWAIWCGNLGASTITNYILYLKNVTGGKIRWFPGNTGGTVTDNASMEMGASGNWTFDDVQFDPTSTGYYINKPSAITVQGNGSGNVTATIAAVPTNESQTANNTDGYVYLLGDWAGGERVNSFPVCTVDNITLALRRVGAATGFAYVRMKAVSDNSTIGTFGSKDVSTIGTAAGGYFFTFSTPVINSTVRDVRFVVEYNGGSAGIALIYQYQNANVSAFGVRTTYLAGAWTDDAASDMTFIIGYNPTTSVSTPVLSAAEHDISAWVDSNRLAIAVDGTIYATAFTGNVTDNGNAYTLCSGNITPYVNTIKFYQAGVLKGYWYWEYGAVFNDHSTNNNTLTPSFRTGTSDPEVSSYLAFFAPVAEAKAPAFAVGVGPDFLSSNITATGNFTTGNVTVMYPGEDIIRSISDATGVPYQIPSTFIGTFILIALSMATSFFLKSYAAPSLFVKSAVNTAGYGVLVALQIYDWWMLIFFFLFEQAIWFAAKERRE